MSVFKQLAPHPYLILYTIPIPTLLPRLAHWLMPTSIKRKPPLEKQKTVFSSEDCGTGIPCNCSIYSSVATERLVYPLIETEGSGTYFTQGIFYDYQFFKGNFEGSFVWKQYGYRQVIDPRYGEYSIGKAVQSPKIENYQGPNWDSSVKINHALILYDASDSDPDFLANANTVEKAIKKQNPGVIIDKVPFYNNHDFHNAFDRQTAFIQNNPGKENVLIYTSSHGHNETFNDNYVEQPGKDILGMVTSTNVLIDEHDYEAHAQNIACEVDRMFMIFDGCGAGAFADYDIKKRGQTRDECDTIEDECNN